MYIDTYVSNFLKRMAIHFCETWFKNNCLLHKVEAGAGSGSSQKCSDPDGFGS